MRLPGDGPDHDHFSYDRQWDAIESMLGKAERRMNFHNVQLAQHQTKSKKWVYHARNYKALEGVVKTLRWTLGDKNIEDPLD